MSRAESVLAGREPSAQKRSARILSELCKAIKYDVARRPRNHKMAGTQEESDLPVKILVTDDEPDLELLIRQRFRKKIQQNEYEFVFANNGAEALDVLAVDGEIRVVLTDLNMPVMDGLTLLSRIGELNRIVKVVIVSAYDDMENIRAAMNRGAFDFLTKPIDFHDFEITVEKTLQQVVLLEEGRRAHEHLAAIRQFFSPGLAEQLERNPDLLEGRNQEVTVLVSDLRGFSQLAEKLGPQQTCRFIRDMMERLSNRIVEHDGLIVDYAGDGILAMWNAPIPQEGHAERACRAAIAMLAEMPGLESDWKRVLHSPLTLGIGINTGTAQVGNTGSTRKFKYGPHGHTVNLASRVQNLSKYFGSPLLVSAATRSGLPSRFAARRLGLVGLAGMDTPVEVHELAPVSEPGSAWLAYRDAYEGAVAMYEAGRFEEAHRSLLDLVETQQRPDSDAALKLLIERVRTRLNNPSSPSDPTVYRAH
jgi:adenylate cyclase